MAINYIIILSILLLSGCGAAHRNPGTGVWYKQRMEEIEDAYKDKKITYAEYLQLKTSADTARSTFISGHRNTIVY